jgi:hypothetical protein
MASEAVQFWGNFEYKTANVADANAIAVGTIAVVGDGVYTAHATMNDSFGGIFVEGKSANDGKLELRIAKKGVFLMVADGTVTAGELVSLSPTANKVRTMGAASIERLVTTVGRALTTVTTGLQAQIEIGGP